MKITQLILSHYGQSDTKDSVHARKGIMHKRELRQDSTISSTVFITNKPFTELSSLTHCGQLILQNQFSGEVKNTNVSQSCQLRNDTLAKQIADFQKLKSLF